MTTTARAAVPAAGTPVSYHGSRTRSHGEWVIAGVCTCQRCRARALAAEPSRFTVRYELADIWGRDRMTCVRREDAAAAAQKRFDTAVAALRAKLGSAEA